MCAGGQAARWNELQDAGDGQAENSRASVKILSCRAAGTRLPRLLPQEEVLGLGAQARCSPALFCSPWLSRLAPHQIMRARLHWQGSSARAGPPTGQHAERGEGLGAAGRLEDRPHAGGGVHVHLGPQTHHIGPHLLPQRKAELGVVAVDKPGREGSSRGTRRAGPAIKG